MINISNCPITGLKRKLDYDFLIKKSSKEIIVNCFIKHYDANDVHINNARISDYKRPLIASDSLVDVNGVLDENGVMSEFDYYNQLGLMPVAIYTQIEGLIALRDSQNKFNI